MVRLKGTVAQGNDSRINKFQFQNGSIKSDLIGSIFVVRLLFQFQNGSIKSDLIGSIFVVRLLFQFQNGSIKRIMWY